MLPVSDTSSPSPFTSRSLSISLANTSSTIDVFENSTVVLGYTDPVGTQRRPPLVQMSDPLASARSHEPPFPLPPGGSFNSVGASSSQPGKHEHLLRSGKLGMCTDPYCSTCPPDHNLKAPQVPTPTVSGTSDSSFHNALDDDAKGWTRRFATYADKYLPRIRNPHSKHAQIWTKFFVLSCLLSIFADPLFFFPIEVYKKYMCMRIDWRTTFALLAVRSVTDVLFVVNILFQFRWAYVAPESTIVGAGQLVDDPIKIASRYYRGNFFLDLFIVLPLPQILLVGVIPHQLGTSWANSTKNLLRFAVLVQYIPKLHRLFPLLAGQTPKGFIVESALAKFFINLLTFMLAGHVVGSCWYLFGLQRVNHCLRDACGNSGYECKKLIDCGREKNKEVLQAWISNERAKACFQEDGFHYGIYWKAVNLTTNTTLWYTRYSYSLFWGFQQISTLAGNQVPSYYFGEVLFTMIIIGLGLLLFALLIGNMQNFLLSLGRRDMEMTLRQRDVEQWMSHKRFPKDIRKRVRDAERLNWNATRGVNEELLFENMHDDLQRDIRRHLFAFLKKVRIFSKMDEPILDAIRERLKHKTYLNGSTVLHRGDLVKKMVFIVRGKMEYTGEDGFRIPLLEGDVYDGTRIKMPSKGLFSNRDVKCVTNVEAFSLSVADLDDVMSLFPTLEIHKQL
ncbi:hypothetical protein F2Q70_00010101 [Brassica cretica]|uniref:Cyclic nucleotide-binding domain-containing protein n=1 Tax=Brassica cretica TaxID=69181 RepID=A0A8S9MCK3_BRACR|nr:hypothetical protein F2Q70_00010101 [Brassica cretica]